MYVCRKYTEFSSCSARSAERQASSDAILNKQNRYKKNKMIMR